MSFGTQKQNSVVLTGDSEIKELSKQKAELHADISAFGADLDAIRKQIQSHKDLTNECDLLSEAVEGLSKNERELSGTIRDLEKQKERLESLLHSKQTDIDALKNLDVQIAQKQKELRDIGDVVLDAEQKHKAKKLLMDNQMSDWEKKSTDVLSERNRILNEIKEIKSQLEAELANKRLAIEELESLKQKIKATSAELYFEEGKLNAIKDEALVAKKSMDDSKVEFSKNKILAEEKMRVELEKIQAIKDALTIREGNASRHEAVLETRVAYLRTVKTRLENALGKSIDLNIE